MLSDEELSASIYKHNKSSFPLVSLLLRLYFLWKPLSCFFTSNNKRWWGKGVEGATAAGKRDPAVVQGKETFCQSFITKLFCFSPKKNFFSVFFFDNKRRCCFTNSIIELWIVDRSLFPFAMAERKVLVYRIVSYWTEIVKKWFFIISFRWNLFGFFSSLFLVRNIISFIKEFASLLSLFFLSGDDADDEKWVFLRNFSGASKKLLESEIHCLSQPFFLLCGPLFANLMALNSPN